MLGAWKGATPQAEAEYADGTERHIIHRGIFEYRNRVHFADDTEIVRWGLAQANWTNVAGNESYVECRECDDRAGTSPGTAVTVFLPRVGSLDPNVRAGDVIPFLIDLEGDAVCCGDYLDDAIGTVKGWKGSVGAVPGGWQSLAAAAGRVLVGYNAADADYDNIAETGGAKTHTHGSGTSGVPSTNTTDAASGNTGSASGSITLDGYTAYSTTGIVPNPAGWGHTHGITFTKSTDITLTHGGSEHVVHTVGTGDGTSPDASDSNVGMSYDEPNSGAGHRHSLAIGDGATASASEGSHTHTLGSHTHTMGNHTHSVPALSATSHVDPYYTVLWIERVD